MHSRQARLSVRKFFDPYSFIFTETIRYMIMPNLEEKKLQLQFSSKVAKIKKTPHQCDGSPSQHQLSWCFHLPFWSDGQIALTPSLYSRHDLLKQIPQLSGIEFPNLILRFLYCYFIQLVVLFVFCICPK